MKTPINVARTKQWKLRVTLKGCCIVWARDGEQGSSSPVRYECSEQRAMRHARLYAWACVQGDGQGLWAHSNSEMRVGSSAAPRRTKPAAR